MANYVTRIRTEDGDLQIDYNALANLPNIPSSIVVDDTLTQSGACADAKATGDKISDLTQDISDLSQEVADLGDSIEIVGSSCIKSINKQLPDSIGDLTLTGSNGVSVSGTTITNSGVRTIGTGTSNGTISVNTNGTTSNVAVKGLGSAAYTSSTVYVTKTMLTLEGTTLIITTE